MKQQFNEGIQLKFLDLLKEKFMNICKDSEYRSKTERLFIDEILREVISEDNIKEITISQLFEGTIFEKFCKNYVEYGFIDTNFIREFYYQGFRFTLDLENKCFKYFFNPAGKILIQGDRNLSLEAYHRHDRSTTTMYGIKEIERFLTCHLHTSYETIGMYVVSIETTQPVHYFRGGITNCCQEYAMTIEPLLKSCAKIQEINWNLDFDFIKQFEIIKRKNYSEKSQVEFCYNW